MRRGWNSLFRFQRNGLTYQQQTAGKLKRAHYNKMHNQTRKRAGRRKMSLPFRKIHLQANGRVKRKERRDSIRLRIECENAWEKSFEYKLPSCFFWKLQTRRMRCEERAAARFHDGGSAGRFVKTAVRKSLRPKATYKNENEKRHIFCWIAKTRVFQRS